MSTLSAQTIRLLCTTDKNGLAADGLPPLISPFVERGIAHGRTYGLSACGYDVTLKRAVWLFPLFGRLAQTNEDFYMRDWLKAEVKDKSTGARKFYFVQNTILEPGWNGNLTLELTRDRPWPIRLKAGTPIAQIVFERLDKPTDQPYRGKYQGQASDRPTPAILEGVPSWRERLARWAAGQIRPANASSPTAAMLRGLFALLVVWLARRAILATAWLIQRAGR